MPITRALALQNMKSHQLYIYTEETYIHAQIALSNYRAFLHFVDDPSSRQCREVWMYLQIFLFHFGMVSKMLYAPSAKKTISKQRAKELRKHLEVDESSALNDPDARNVIENFDERMDDWLNEESKDILESVFENKSEYDGLDKKKWVIRRVYLVAESIFITEERGEPKEMELQPIVEALSRLLGVCLNKLEVVN